MAKVQTRRTVCIVREDFGRLRAFCEEHAIPMSQVVSQAVRAVLDGRVKLEPVRTAEQLGAETSARRGLPLTTRQATAIASPVFVPNIRGTCAICTEPCESLIPTRLDPGGPTYRICPSCFGELPGPSAPRRQARERRARTERRPEAA